MDPVRVQPRPQRGADAEPHADLAREEEHLGQAPVRHPTRDRGVQEHGQGVRGRVRGGHGREAVALGVERAAGVGVEPGRRGAQAGEPGERGVPRACGFGGAQAVDEFPHRRVAQPADQHADRIEQQQPGQPHDVGGRVLEPGVVGEHGQGPGATIIGELPRWTGRG
ncbi:hypothetical protein BJF90_12080 [Pseudonocardia sp. CNS-004]|nr:hypothetical protein BJF90_12080 [Pseudonocardia sp. CNS-004]